MQRNFKDVKICEDVDCPYTLRHHHVITHDGSYIKYHVPKQEIKEDVYYADTSR